MHRTVTVVAEAVPFCFGPIATLLPVTDILAARGAKIIYLASGPAAQLLRLSQPQTEVVPCNTVKHAEVCEHRKLLTSADVVLTNTNPELAVWTLDWGCRVALLDTLFWMWDHIDPQLASCRPYIIQDFVGVEEQKRRIRGFEAAPVVGPLVAPQAAPLPASERRNSLVISFGGVDCPLVPPDAPKYPEGVIGPILAALQRSHPFDEVLICGGGNLAERLSKHSLPRGIRVECLPHQEHVESLRRCRAAVVSPGLTSFFELLRADTPAFFLPPQNYSQVLQLRRYREMGVAPFSFSWDDLGLGNDLGLYWPETPAVARVRECLDAFTRSPDHQRQLTDRLTAFLQNPCADTAAAELQTARRRYAANGPEQAADAILSEIT